MRVIWSFGTIRVPASSSSGGRARLHYLLNRGDYELGLLVVDVVSALLGDDVLAPGDERGDLVLKLPRRSCSSSGQVRSSRLAAGGR